MNVRAIAALAIVAPLSAFAADLPISYFVEAKPLQAQAPAGTALTFDLFSDNTCTTSVQSTVVNAEDVLIVSKLKQSTPKGDVKLPLTAELRTTIPGVTTPGNLYLRVTGTGVNPVGGACQPQAAQAAGGAQTSPCFDHIENGNETDVDCGGPDCGDCSVGNGCAGNADCVTNSCVASVCNIPASSEPLLVPRDRPIYAPCADNDWCSPLSDGFVNRVSCVAHFCLVGGLNRPNGSNCDVDSECTSSFCDFVTARCADAPAP